MSKAEQEQTVSVSRRVSDGEQIGFFLRLHPALTLTHTAHTMRLKYAGSRMHLYIFNCSEIKDIQLSKIQYGELDDGVYKVPQKRR